MASLLRVARCLCNGTGFTRLNTIKCARNIAESLRLENKATHFNTAYLARCLATPASQLQVGQQDSILERSLRKIDQDVRRTGRIARRDLEEVMEELHETKTVSNTQALLIIRCCGNLLPEESPSVRTQLVLELWKIMEDLGTPLDISHYNALLRVFLENEHVFVPNDFLDKLKSKGIEPNRVTYCRLMARYCQQGDMDGATGVLQVMRDQQLPVNEGVFNTLLMGHSQAGDMESALSIMDLMKQSAVDPSEETYTALMCGYAKCGDMESIKKLLQECKAKEIFLQDKDFMEIIYTLSLNGWSQHVDQIIEVLEKSAGYNQDAINLILRLVNINQVDIGLKMLKTMPRALLPDGKLAPTGIFFIRQLVKTKQPTEKIIEVCQELMNSELNPRALQVAVEHSLYLGAEYSEQSEALLRAIQSTDPFMKQHKFWPLLVSRGKEGDIPGMLAVVERMKKDYNLAPSNATLRDYVIPYLPQDLSSDGIVDTLKSAQVSTASAACAVVAYRLGQHNIADAANIAGRFTAHYAPVYLRRSLATAYLHSKDLPSYFTILHKIVESIGQTSNSSSNAEVTPAQIVGSFVIELANLENNKQRAPTVMTVLKGLVEEGLGMDKESSEQLKPKLGNELTEEISNLLEQLTAGDLTPRARRSYFSRTSTIEDIPRLEKMKSNLEGQSESTLGVRKQLLSLYCRKRDLDKTEDLKATLDEEKFVYPSGSLAQLIDLYTHHENLDKAWSLYQQLKHMEPDFSLGHTKVVKLASLLVKNNRVSDCVEFLKDQGKNREPLNEPSFSYNNTCWKLLNSLAEDGKSEEVKEIFDALVKNQYITVTNMLLGPLVRAHIIRGDLPAALQEFEHCCQEYHLTPYKNDLTCKLIMAEDSIALQKLTDLSTGIHGEVNSLYDLVFSFVECGKIRHAKRILETPGLGSRPQRVSSACERFCQDGQVHALEGLLDATKDVAHIVDRSVIYYSVLKRHVEANEVEKGIELWTRMQEEDVTASDQFLWELGTLIQKNGRDAPFVIPKKVSQESVLSRDVEKPQPITRTPAVTNPITRLRNSLKANNLGSETEGDASTSYTMELKKMAADLISNIVDKKITPKSSDLKFALNHLSSAGEMNSVEAIGNLLSDAMKKTINYEKFLCIASAMTGKGEEYLTKLEGRINEAKSEDLEALRDNYPRGGSTTLLIHNPQLRERFEDMARTYAVRDIYFPINDLWAYLFESGAESQAGELWSEFLAKTPKIVLEHVLETARTTNDIALGQRLVNQLKCSDKMPKIIGSAYNCLADLHIAKKESQEAIKVLEEAIKGNFYEGVKRQTIKRLEALLQSEGKTLPDNVPNLRVKSSTSRSTTSNSDDEK